MIYYQTSNPGSYEIILDVFIQHVTHTVGIHCPTCSSAFPRKRRPLPIANAWATSTRWKKCWTRNREASPTVTTSPGTSGPALPPNDSTAGRWQGLYTSRRSM